MIKERLQRILPGATNFFTEYRELTFLQLSRALNTQPHSGRMPSNSLIEAASRLAKESGAPLATELMVANLSEGRPVLSANHHGFDTHPEMAQGTLLFGLSHLLGIDPGPVTVLATSAVPLNNPTAPGGLLLGRRALSGRRPQIRAFSRSQDQVLAFRAKALNRKNVTTLLERLGSLSELSSSERKRFSDFIERYLLNSVFLGKRSFVGQSSWLASAVWAGRLGQGSPPLIQIELEALVSTILVGDLSDRDSPLFRALFEEKTRTALVKALSGLRGAWSPELSIPDVSSSFLSSTDSKGTLFFWQVDSSGRRRPMGLGQKAGRAFLKGPDLEIPLSAEPIATALAERLLLPGLALDYIVLSVHGLKAHGGVFMIDYLPALLGPASNILEVPLLDTQNESSGPSRYSLHQARPLLASGALPIGLADQGAPGGFAAAGTLELDSAGPLTSNFLNLLASLSLAQVWPFTASEWYQEETPLSERLPGWDQELGRPALLLELS